MENEFNSVTENPIKGFNWRVDVLSYPTLKFICPYCEDAFKRVRSNGKGLIFKYCPSCGMKIQK